MNNPVKELTDSFSNTFSAGFAPASHEKEIEGN